jgi:DNA-binding GntR family transcriptional regulator
MKSVNSDTAYDYIRERILSGAYLPGSTLTTSQLAEEIGVSRTPVRDALRQLEADGLVVIRAHFGANVRTVSFREFREMCAMRLALESYAAGFAAVNRSAEDLRELGQALEAMRLSTKKIGGGQEADLQADLVREDIRFHIAILTAAQNTVIRQEILRLHLVNRIVSARGAPMISPVDQVESAANRREVLAEHEAIYQTIADRDAEGAKRAMDRHIQKLIDKQIALRERMESVPKSKKLTEEEMIYST